MYGIYIYLHLGDFLVQMLVNIPAPWSILEIIGIRVVWGMNCFEQLQQPLFEKHWRQRMSLKFFKVKLKLQQFALCLQKKS